jgi:hypothetical protein
MYWAEILWPRPFSEDAARAILTHLATAERHCHLVFETRAAKGKIRYLMGASEKACLAKAAHILKSALPAIRLESKAANIKRGTITIAANVKTSHPSLSLGTNHTAAVIRAVLASLAQTKQRGEETLLQVVLGKSHTPSPLPKELPDPSASWLNVISGNVGPASAESRRQMKEKAECHNFETAVRIGAAATDEIRTRSHIRAVFAALKTAEAAGIRLKLTQERAEAVNAAKRPWHFAVRLSCKELPLFLGWPIGDEYFEGVAGLHPRPLLPPEWLKCRERCFATDITGRKIGIALNDALNHTVLTGPTGSGKSTVMLNMATEDIAAGRSVLVIDPKQDLVTDLLERIPANRMNDVVVIDPTSQSVVGINPITCGDQNPTLVADGVLSVFKTIWEDSWGVYTQDILSGSLLTLARIKGATLLMLPALLTDDNFRHRITRNIQDPVGLGAFWANYEAMSKSERNRVIAPVLNRLRQFTMRPELRAVLGQAEPKFNLAELFEQKRIVLVPLNKATIGHENARLLGSLIISQIWNLALGRADIPSQQRTPVLIYVDELQNYLSFPTDTADALSQARGFKLGLILAHQYRAQLSTEVKHAIDANCANKIIFGLNAADAAETEKQAPELEKADFMLLPRYGVYTSVQSNGRTAGWMMGQTLPPCPAVRSAHEMKAFSTTRYGKNTAQVELEYMSAIHGEVTRKNRSASIDKAQTAEPIGRRKREKND